jgi:2-keto-4-pentenoate hydratase/2-oxohepta-3-ene-1,7-dioic acid hydratase in catechol pathway
MTYRLFQYHDAKGQVRGALQLDERGTYDLGGRTVDGLLEQWDESVSWLNSLADRLASEERAPDGITPLLAEALNYAPPVLRPRGIYAAGANYRDHVQAMARVLKMNLTENPKADGIPPWHFIKATSTLIGHDQAVSFPEHVRALDWEAELAVVIGRPARRVPVEQALSYVAGYSCANDLSARDQLKREKVDASSPFRFDWVGSKNFDGACPLGPYLTPAHFVASPEALSIKLWVNERLRQDSSTANHLYSVAEQIAYLSERVTLWPGDMLLTGTPAGVGAESGTFLAKGDRLRVQIEGLGELHTQLV